MGGEVSVLEAEMKPLSISTIKMCKVPKIAIIWHPDCELHYIPTHPEKPQRVKGILKELHKVYSPDIFFEAPLVTEEQILDFHSQKHLDLFLSKYEEAVQKKADNQSPFGKYLKIISLILLLCSYFMLFSFIRL